MTTTEHRALEAPALEGGLSLDDASRARAAALAGRLEALRASYYQGTPEVSDAAYDALEDELRALDPTHPVLAKVGSGALATEWEKARHELPMGSLNKVTSEAELGEWLARNEELLRQAEAPPGDPRALATSLFVAEKLDGISIEVIYEGGRFRDAITRGDGVVGERISPNVARMKGVPPRIPTRPGREGARLSVRGEIILRTSDLVHFPGAVSARNQAAGVAKRLDGAGAEHLTALFYDVADDLEHSTEHDKLAFLRGLGLATPRWVTTDPAGLVELYRRYERQERDRLDYEIDGLVVRLDSIAAQELLGELNRRPRGAVAFKFPSPAKLSRVRAITWEVGPTGRVTPVALVDPVELVGARVQNVSLHNAANVRELGVAVGDEVLVSRRNDVIPYIEEVVTHEGELAPPPSRCPVCEAGIEQAGEYLLCPNTDCPARVRGRIKIWIKVIGALEWGDKLVEQVTQRELVREPADLYRLTWQDLAGLERRGEKSAKKCLAEITSKLPLDLPTFVAALGVPGVGLETARLVVGAGFDSLEALRLATVDELAAVKGLGPAKAALVVEGLAAREEEIVRLAEVGVVPITREAAGPLAGKTFCFTGAAPVPRPELTKRVEGLGARVLSGVTRELQYLVMGEADSTSSKAQKARQLGVTLLTYPELFAMLERPPAE